ncbi:uncharacterized protein [Clytia hemisphaerica]
MTSSLEFGILSLFFGNGASLRKGSSSKGGEVKNKCIIPILDPWHKDVAPFIDYKWRHQKCRIKRKVKLERGILKVNLENIQRAGFYYVRRKDEDTNQYSRWHSLRDTQKDIIRNQTPVCLQISDREKLILSPMTPNSQILSNEVNGINSTEPKSAALVATNRTNCNSDSSKFIFKKDHTIIHMASGRCIVPKGDTPNQPIVLLPIKSRECRTRISKFKALPDGKIRHKHTGKCLHFNLCGKKSNEGFFDLVDCTNGTSLHYYAGEKLFKKLEMEVAITEDIIKFQYIQSNLLYTEYFIYPVHRLTKNKHLLEKQTAASQDDNKLNVMYLMIDSISRASGQRYLNETYKMLEEDPNSVIMKGHTIVGDGTTAQVLAILVGEQERHLPEARRGHNFSKPVDNWPWIWKEYHQKGYVSVFGEDDAGIGTFNYRLNGFNNTPSNKYLRPWYIEIDTQIRWSKKFSTDCSHKLAFQYLKDLYYEYQQEKKFIFHASNLGHNEPALATSMDNDLKQLLKYMNKTGALDNTVLVIFGDHGDRTAAFRKTMQGKLEERLPFVSITVPSRMRNKFPMEFKNLVKNSEILTSHYDLYATNLHLANFPELPLKQHRYGKSLFTDITALQRECADAGVEETWCPCVSYEMVDKNNDIVLQMAYQVVEKFNQYLRENPTVSQKCEQLVLDEVLRVRKVTTSKQVEYFVTTENSECDGCGIQLNQTASFVNQKFELLIQVKPSDGQFEMLVDYNSMTNRIEVGEDFVQRVSRINRYGDQPKCVQRQYPYHRAFCFCKDNQK